MTLGGQDDGKFISHGLDKDLATDGRKLKAAKQAILNSEDGVIEKISVWQDANKGRLPSLDEFTKPEKEGGLGQREFFRDFRKSQISARGKPDKNIYAQMLYEFGFEPE